MIDDDLDALRSTQAGSTADDAKDPLATRVPHADDPFLTKVGTTTTTWPDPIAGASLSGRPSAEGPRFRIIREHARGGIGEVYLALDQELKREVALKEIQARHADDFRSRARFLLEAEVTGSLEHPGVVPVYALGHHPDGRPYYAMRFIKGDSLKESVDRHQKPSGQGQRPDPAERSLRLRLHLSKFVDICNAMAYAHSRGVLHRDLKPDNIMLGPYGEALVVDWGLAKWLSRPGVEDLGAEPPGSGTGTGTLSSGSCETMAGSVVGTPAFMSPEQAAGDLDRLGPASDIYSLGATLYYVLTGRTPFERLGVLEILERVQKGEFPPPRAVRRAIPRSLEAISLKAMATRPENRYPSARALADDVERWLAGASVSAYPDRLPARILKWCRRHPVVTTAGVSCLFLDFCCLVISLLGYVQTVLHAGADRAGVMSRLNVAAALLVMIPFAGQAGALIGMAAGAIVGGAWRRTVAGLYRGASVGLKVGVPSSVVLYLGLGAFNVARPPAWVPVAPPPRPVVLPLAYPRLPGASEGLPSWIKPSGPIDVAAFFHEPPRDRNAAPLYLDAFLEFDEGMAVCFSDDEGKRRSAITGPRQKHLEDLYAACKADPAAVDRAALDALLEEFEVGFLKLKVAQRREACVFRAGLGFFYGRPHAQAAGTVARAMALQAARRVERGEIDRAIDDLESLLRLARDFQPRGDVIVQLVSIAIENVANIDVLGSILRAPGLRVEPCDRLREILDKHSRGSLDPFLEAYRAEYVRTGNTIRRYVEERDREEKLGGSGARNTLRSLLGLKFERSVDDPEAKSALAKLEAKIDAQLARTTASGFAESTYRALGDFHREMLGLASLPLLGRIEAAGALQAKRLGDHPLLLQFGPDAEATKAALKAFGRAEAARGAMRCLVALRRRVLAGNGEIGGLEEVVKAGGMERVPTDPFRHDGGPLRMVVIEGEPIIYSVGIDGQDDGGLLEAKPGDTTRGDYLFRLRPKASSRD